MMQRLAATCPARSSGSGNVYVSTGHRIGNSLGCERPAIRQRKISIRFPKEGWAWHRWTAPGNGMTHVITVQAYHAPRTIWGIATRVPPAAPWSKQTTKSTTALPRKFLSLVDSPIASTFKISFHSHTSRRHGPFTRETERGQEEEERSLMLAKGCVLGCFINILWLQYNVLTKIPKL
eukprot:686138-Rhodomonas_salina.1